MMNGSYSPEVINGVSWLTDADSFVVKVSANCR